MERRSGREGPGRAEVRGTRDYIKSKIVLSDMTSLAC